MSGVVLPRTNATAAVPKKRVSLSELQKNGKVHYAREVRLKGLQSCGGTSRSDACYCCKLLAWPSSERAKTTGARRRRPRRQRKTSAKRSGRRVRRAARHILRGIETYVRS
jgi:hypothetical protein